MRYNVGMAEEIITGEMRGSLKESFKVLASEINIHVFIKKGSNDQYNNLTVQPGIAPLWKSQAGK